MTKSSRRKFISTAVVFAASATPAAAIHFMPMKNKYPIVHHVFFWLKNPASVQDRDQLIAGIKTLSKIDTVHQLRVALPASTEKREVVENSWSVSELIFFSDLTAQATYQTHPVHLEFVKNCGHLWGKVIVYDGADV